MRYIDYIVCFSDVHDLISFYDKYGYFVYTDRVHCALPQVFKSKIIFTQRQNDQRNNSLNRFSNIIQLGYEKDINDKIIERAIDSSIDKTIYIKYKAEYDYFNEIIGARLNQL